MVAVGKKNRRRSTEERLRPAKSVKEEEQKSNRLDSNALEIYESPTESRIKKRIIPGVVGCL